ncbi:hypothetical protein [Marinomonas algicola]|uniref:hypothetical protein n=1 Tax=Marinomonas algicola TaxID=2773454 RepID=UPI00174E0D30|nr:hypothetical protein [Marinomonas algicola]
MKNLQMLLISLEQITLQDISEIPHDKQHEVAIQVEKLQEQLRQIQKERTIYRCATMSAI